MSPARPGAFAANFKPEILNRFRDLCKEQGLQYSKELEKLAETYVETGGECVDYALLKTVWEQDAQERDRLAGLLSAAGISYKNGETADDYKRQKFEQQTEFLIKEIETLKARVSKLEGGRQG